MQGGDVVKAYFLFTAGGPMVILTSHNDIEDPRLLEKLESKGIPKFVACEVSLESAKTKYDGHFDLVCQDLHETDDLRVLDYNGQRIYTNFKFADLGEPLYHDPD